ncbi:MAG: CHAT domain-containing protein [Prevotella sp.]|nr:CHAT domain-containing protein [Prevotella sp.]
MKRAILCCLLFHLSFLCLGQTASQLIPMAEELFHEADSLKSLHEDNDAAVSAILGASYYADSYGKESLEYGMALGRVAPYLFASDYDWEKPLKEGLYIISEAKGVQCDEYAQLLTIYADYEYNDSLLKKDFAQQAVDIRKKVLGTQHPDYAHSLAILADCYDDEQHYDEAISLLTEAISVLRGHEDTHAKELGNALNRLMSICRRCGRHDEGIASMAELLELKKRILGKEHKSTIKTMRDLASYYRHVGDELKAYQLQNEANQLTSQAEIGSSDLYYVEPLSELAYAYEAQGRFDLAIPLCERILDIYKNNTLEQTREPSFVDSMFIAQAATRLSKCCQEGRKYHEAIEAATEACNIWDSYHLNKDTTYVDLLNTLAICHYRLDLPEYAGAFARKGMEILENNPEQGTDNLTYALSLRIQSEYLSETGEMEQASGLLRKALDIIGRHKGKNTSSFAYCQQQLAKAQVMSGMEPAAIMNYNESMATIKQLVLLDFSMKSPSERQKTWKSVEHLFVDSYPRFVIENHFYRDEAEIGGLLYDYSALFAKGLLLSAETSIADMVRRTESQELVMQLSGIQEKRERLERFYQNPDTQRSNEVTQLSREIEQGEKELVLKLKDAGYDYTGMLKTTWRDVKAVLGKQDIAVEFITFTTSLGDLITLAITLRSDDAYPQIQMLFDSNFLRGIDMDAISQKPIIYFEMSWGNLGNRLNGIKNIYFSPSGFLHSLSIENLPGCEAYNFYRLSSTRELVARREHEKVRQAALYGGLYYNVNPEEMEAESRAYEIDEDHQAFNSRSMVDDLVSRGALSRLPYLEGTNNEVEAISMMTKDNHIKTSSFTGSKGNEESFKGLSGSDIQLLHIATHGFYRSEEREDNDTEPDIMFGEYQRSNEDKALSRCGLLMSGADNAILGKLPNGVEDGVLTAQEIAQLDLSTLQLVVLSACETALGDVSRSEGVFGLQRGFKKAGAQSLIMSLWKVDDEATCFLMKEFYKNWLGGMSKHEALEQAKRAVRAHEEKGWDDPKYWAAFILLDGLE